MGDQSAWNVGLGRPNLRSYAAPQLNDPSRECKLVDDDGNVVGFDEEGEFYFRGPNVMMCVHLLVHFDHIG